jgi:hypothetical protein
MTEPCVILPDIDLPLPKGKADHNIWGKQSDND